VLAFSLACWSALRFHELLEAAWTFDTDDAFITFRYARHLVEGRGIVWNVGEAPVEGYSNFSTLLISALALAQNKDPLFAVKVVNVVSAAVACGLSYFAARSFVGPLLAIVPAVVLTSDAGETMWAVSGLETGFYQALTVAAVYCALRGLGFRTVSSTDDGGRYAPGKWDAFWIAAAAFFALAAGLTRPEGPLVAVAIAGALCLRLASAFGRERTFGGLETRLALRRLGLFVLVFGAPYLAYFGWRVAYFGRLLPNTVYCKAFWDGDPWTLIGGFWKTWPYLPLLALAHPLRRWDTRLFVLWAIPAMYFVVLYGADPIIGHRERHFLAAIVLMLIAAAGALGFIGRAMLQRPGFLHEIPIVLGVVALTSLSHESAQREVTEWNERYRYRSQVRVDLGEELAQLIPGRGTVVIGDVGVVGYATQHRILDAFCLNSREMTTPPIDMSAVRYAKWVVAQKPDVIVVHSRHAAILVPRPEYGFYRALIEQPSFKTEYVKASSVGAQGFHYFVYRRLSELEVLVRGEQEQPDEPLPEADVEADNARARDLGESGDALSPKETPDE
jgi:hypothetical protein